MEVEQHAIDQILNSVPAAQRSAMLQSLISPSPEAFGFAGGQIVAEFPRASDPLLAHWLSVIASVRAASAKPAAANFAEDRARPVGERVFVTVADDATRDTTSVAVLRPSDAFPVLLLRRDADALELRAGLRVAAKLFKDFGLHPDLEHRAAVPPKEAEITAPSTAQKLLAWIQTSEPRYLPGLGRLPAIEVVHYTRR